MALERSDLDRLKSTLSQLDVQLQTTDGADQSDLLALRHDVVELITLQEEQLLDKRKAELLKQLQSQLVTYSDAIEADDPVPAAATRSTDVTEELRNVLIGQRCSIIGWTANGRFLRQNAVISDVVDNGDSDTKLITSSPLMVTAGRVRVFLTHPTRTTDLPCEQFMADGFCRRGIRCPWSHGKVVSSEDIGEWDEPDASLYLNEGQPCLVKENPHSTHPSIWKHAHLLHTDLEAHTCVIQWGHTYRSYFSGESSNKNGSRAGLIRQASYDQLEATVANVPLHAVWPLSREQSEEDEKESEAIDQDNTFSTDSDESSNDELHHSDTDVSQSVYRFHTAGSDSNTGHNRDVQLRHGNGRSKVSFVPGGVLSPADILRAMPYPDPICTPHSERDQDVGQLGSWEAHTRGIGSLLLAKMGYPGQGGLGVHGRGRSLPVAVLLEKFQILSHGWNKRPSLDRVLRTSECSHKRPPRGRRELACNQAPATDGKETANGSVRQPYLFQFLNNALQRPISGDKEPCTSGPNIKNPPQEMSKLKGDSHVDPTSDDFRIQFFRTHEEISRTKQQIHRTRESIERNQGRDRAMTKQAEQRLVMLQAQLDQLRNRERTLQQSKNKHNTEKKLRIF